jgi:arginyl-tRNA synthetase
MKNLITVLHLLADEAIRSAFDGAVQDAALMQSEITPSTQAQFGHYQCNSALKIAKALRISPREAAEKIVSCFSRRTLEGKEMISKLEVAGPGFINITLSNEKK